jgi:hypothetical protein
VKPNAVLYGERRTAERWRRGSEKKKKKKKKKKKRTGLELTRIPSNTLFNCAETGTGGPSFANHAGGHCWLRLTIPGLELRSRSNRLDTVSTSGAAVSRCQN